MEFDRTQPIEYPPEPFEFTGSGSEYFRIWIVNLSLTILTLGIYSAWAKVRRLQYFYRNTRVAGGVFDYHGDPIAILKGRILAVALLVTWNLATDSAGLPMLIAFVLIGGLLPWLLRNSFRFRLHNSSYRGLRFSFRGSVAEAYLVFLGYGLLTIFTLYLAAPFFHQRLKQYQHGQSRFGRTPFTFEASVRSFYGVYLIVGLIGFSGLVLAGLTLGGTFAALRQAGDAPDPSMIAGVAFVVFLFVVVLSLLITPIFQARIGNLVWNGTQLGANRFESRLQARRLFVIQTSNFVLVLLTLGLYAPWAAVRVARYRAESLTLLPQIPVEAFVADSIVEQSAAGEETAEMFDFDIGL